jgi:hypothetical protein
MVDMGCTYGLLYMGYTVVIAYNLLSETKAILKNYCVLEVIIESKCKEKSNGVDTLANIIQKSEIIK